MEDYYNYCLDCKKDTDVVHDHSTGDAICTDCGLVLEARSIDETCEWRTFIDESRDNDPVRVGGVINPLLDGCGLGTVISKADGSKGNSFSSPSMRRLQNKGLKSCHRSLVAGFGDIAEMAERLGLVATIKGRANEIYKKVHDAKSTGKSKDDILAACLYIACRQEGKARTLKEICTVVDGATKEEITRAIKNIKKLGISMNQPIAMATVRAADYLKRFCSRLGMKHQEIKAAEDTAEKLEELDIRRSPVSVAAAVIYMITQLSTERKPLKDIVQLTQVAEATIRSTYKDVYPHASRIIPAFYANEEDLRKLCCP